MARLIRQFMPHQKFVLIFLVGVATFYVSSSAISAEPNDATPSVGSLALSDLNDTLLNQSVTLRQEVKQALKAVKKDDVGCVAPLMRRPFSELNNSRIAPFSCYFAKNKTLTIQAKSVAQLPDGETIPLQQLLKRQTIPQGATLQYQLTAWKWTDAKH